MNERASAAALRKIFLAVNCHGWEDFPTRLPPDQAGELLASWTAMWHPRILAAMEDVPGWHRMDQLPQQADRAIVVVPPYLRAKIDGELMSDLEKAGGAVLDGGPGRDEVVQRLLDCLGQPAPNGTPANSRGFFSLGYCYLQVQLMTRQLRYVSTLDLQEFHRRLFAAVNEPETAGRDDRLQACFDLLIEERCRYYPATASLLDLCFLAQETPLEDFVTALGWPHRFSVQLPGKLLPRLAGDANVGAKLRERIRAEMVSLAVGPWEELKDPLLSSATACEQLAHSRRALLDTFPDAPAATFARRRAGIGPLLPGLVRLAGATSAVHATLDDGVFPQTTPNHMRWKGGDGAIVDALAAPPKLAQSPDTWLGLGPAIGEGVDAAHHATMLIVHFPCRECDSFHDLVYSTRFGDVLGRFTTLDQYFDQVGDPGYSQDYSADSYRYPWLAQAVTAGAVNPVSQIVDYWQARLAALAREGLWSMLAALNDCPVETLTSLTEARDRVDAISEGGAERDAGVGETCRQLAVRLAQALPREKAGATGEQHVATPDARLIVNPFSFPLVLVRDGERVDVPGTGFSRVTPQPAAKSQARRRKKNPPPLIWQQDGEHLMGNEWFTCTISGRSGGIRSVRIPHHRTTLLSQQIGIRQAVAGAGRSRRTGRYTEMIAEQIEMVESTKATAAIEAKGHLLRENKPEATFRQTTRIDRFQPWITIEINVDLHDEIAGPPWDHYLAHRLAWRDESAQLSTWLNETRFPTSQQQITAPLALEIEQPAGNTCLFTGGLPFHQRIGYSRLDTILAPAGEQRRNWRVGIGVSPAYPLTSALQFLAQPLDVPLPAETPRQAWLFHLDRRNVVVVQWSPARQTANGDEASGDLSLLVRETEGRSTDVTLDCFRPIERAWLVDLTGTRLQSLPVNDGKTSWSMSGRGLAMIEIAWRRTDSAS